MQRVLMIRRVCRTMLLSRPSRSAATRRDVTAQVWELEFRGPVNREASNFRHMVDATGHLRVHVPAAPCDMLLSVHIK
jgi:hypothetical protein